MLNIVWFKRDLRIDDHWPLAQAAQRGNCVCLFIYEPELLQSPEFDAAHLEFLNQCLVDLDRSLRERGGHLTLRTGTAVEVFESLRVSHGITGLWSHQETGNQVTYRRDQAVARWAANQGIPWSESTQNGVVRRLKSRDGWAARRTRWIQQPIVTAPPRIDSATGVPGCGFKTASELEVAPHSKLNLPRGGSSVARELLDSFLTNRGRNYISEMSSPVTADVSCSRLSPYLAWGCISVRQVHHEVRNRRDQLKAEAPAPRHGPWLRSLKAFESRLSWRCHFMQKLEDEPEIEFRNMSRAFDGLRENEFSDSHFEAWKLGLTGFPMVDACMRAVQQTGWLNFRMRAMVVSFAAYHLWLHWRPTGLFLARHFLDFEAGIHFSQMQMQSGTTGINTIRVYSPSKQVQDHDPTGEFIRRYVPELAEVPSEYLPWPERMPLLLQSMVGCQIGRDYPRPIVDHLVAYRRAHERIKAVRQTGDAQAEATRVVTKHGSRQRRRR